MTIGHIIHSIVVLVVRMRFVYGVVGKMDVEVINVLCIGQLILLRCEPNQAFVVEVDSEGIARCKQHVDS